MKEYCYNCMEPIRTGEACGSCGFVNDMHESAPHQLKPGTILCERYLLGQVIGQGGFGITYIGRDLRLDMKIAVKEYYPSGYANRNTEASAEMTVTDRNQADFIERGKTRFLEEARVLADLHNTPGVVDVRDFFEANNTAYIVMEYLEGQDLRDYLREKLFQPDDIFKRVMPMAETLEVIHEHNIIHRDISPDNVMMLSNGQMKLMDFGAAREMNFSDQKSVSVLLKAGYAPEEQYRPKGVQGPWTDVYAFCATIYKCITGITPDDALQRLHDDEVRWPSQLGIEISPSLEAILKKGMAVAQEDRYQSFTELKNAVKLALETDGLDMVSLDADADGDAVTVYRRKKSASDADDATKYRPRKSKSNIDATVYKPKKDDREKDERTSLGRTDKGNRDTEEGSSADESQSARRTGSITGDGGGLHNKKAILGIAAAVALCIVIAIALVVSGTLKTDDSATRTEGSQQIILTASDDMSIKDFNSATETLRERLNVFSGEGTYSMSVEADTVMLAIPSDKFGNIGVEGTLQAFLSRPIDLCIGKDDEAKAENIALTRNDIAGVEIVDGPIEGVNPEDYEIDEDYKVIKLTLTTQYVSAHENEMNAWEDDLIVGQDIGNNAWYYWHAIPANDKGAYYLIVEEQEDNYLETLVYNYTHDPLAAGFSFIVERKDDIDWEKPGEGRVTGRNQVEASSLAGTQATIRFTIYNKDDKTDGELLDLETVLKRRLDALAQPYSIGYYETEEYDETTNYVVVKTSPEHLSDAVLQALPTSSSVNVFCDGYQASVYPSKNTSLTAKKNGEGNWTITIGCGDDGLSGDLKKLAGAIKEGDTAYFKPSSATLIAGTLNKKSSTELVFDDLVLPDGSALDTEENEWMAEFYNALYAEETDYYSLSYDDYQITDDGQLIKDQELGLLSKGNEADIQASISVISPKSEVRFSQGYINVYLDLPVNETLPADGLSIAREIYEAVDLGGPDYSHLGIYLIDEDNTTMERARVFFGRDNYDVKPRYTANGIFANGRLVEYQDAFKAIVEKDDFWTSMKSEYSGWTYEF